MTTNSWPKKLNGYEEVEKELANDVRVKLAGIDLNGVLRGKVISKEKFLSCIKHGFLGFCSIVFGWDMVDKPYFKSSKYCGEEQGYSDLLAKVDLSSFRRIPWENDIPFFLMDFYLSENEPLAVCPRTFLKKVIGELNELNLDPACGVEFEWFNYKETPQSVAEKTTPLTNLTPGMFGYSLLRTSLNQTYFDDILNDCYKFGIQVEGLHTETGPGVFEAALAYNQALRMADNATLFKTSVKQIALRHGIIASFMAKPIPTLPGCSGHIHLSLKDIKANCNAFASETDSSSKTLDYFLAGLIVCFPSIMPMLAPTINSYKRLVENYWAPVKVSWGPDNRLAAIRVITPPNCSVSSTRIEVRVPGADQNPALAIATILAAGKYGIENKLENPLPPLKSGDSLAKYPGERLPRTLKDAASVMAAPESYARKIMGDEFIDHYALVCDHEVFQFESAITDWETKRYIELA